MNVQQALLYGTKRLEAAPVDNAAKDVRMLLGHALDCEPSRLFLVKDDEIPVATLANFNQFLIAREKFQPVSQIIGGREFWGRWFKVTSDVLDPRPDTETLIEIALSGVAPKTILDLGTGSGILAVSLAAEWPNSWVTATDISEVALGIAKENAQAHDVDNRINFVKSDWFENVSGQFDLIVSNPPYISAAEMCELAPDVKNWEPDLALTPGGDGLSAYRRIAKKLPIFLNARGMALFEIGHSQAQDVSRIFAENGFEKISVTKDLSGNDRIVVIQG